MTVWLILWRYYDGRSGGVIDRAFVDEEDARWLVKTLVSQGASKQYSLVTVDVKGLDA